MAETHRLPRHPLPAPQRVVSSVRARLARPQIAPEDADRVLRRFGVVDAGRPRNLPLAWRNEIAIVDSSLGRTVLKRYRPNTERDAIVHEHSILDRLAETDVPATRPIRTPGGDSVVECHGRLHALYHFEPGRHFVSRLVSHRTRRALEWHAGALLGRFHRALADFTPAGEHHLGFAPGGARRHDASWCEGAVSALAETPATHDREAEADEAWLRSRASSIVDGVARLAPVVEQANLHTSVIHGDYGTHNLLFRADGTGLVHDLELARVDWPVLDVAMALLRLRPELRSVFLEAYRTTTAIPDADLELLDVVTRYHLLTGAVRVWEAFGRTGNADRLAKARSRVEQEAALSGIAPLTEGTRS
ncbi:MAG: phosphotransferase [Actinomycetota bacterium]